VLAEQREAARVALRAAIERADGQPDEVVSAARRAADQLLAVAAPAPEELGAARAALLAAIDETPRYQEAAQQRAAVREAADRTVLAPHGRRTLKRAAKLIRNADAAMEARRWDEAADGYRAALGEYEAAPKATSRTPWRAIAGAAAAALLVALAWWGTAQWRSQPSPSRARIASASPSAEAVTIKGQWRPDVLNRVAVGCARERHRVGVGR
jgi:type VI protein secretion system component VasF